jgi:hypothetical protein
VIQQCDLRKMPFNAASKSMKDSRVVEIWLTICYASTVFEISQCHRRVRQRWLLVWLGCGYRYLDKRCARTPETLRNERELDGVMRQIP